MNVKKILDFIVKLLATGGFVGTISPILSGTLGSLVGVVIYILLSKDFITYIIVTVILLVISIPVSSYAEKHIYKEKDPHYVVIDEIVGFLITMLGFSFWPVSISSLNLLIIGFILFRIFDSLKPYPVYQLQRLERGLGIVADDLVAGLLSNLSLRALKYLAWIINYPKF